MFCCSWNPDVRRFTSTALPLIGRFLCCLLPNESFHRPTKSLRHVWWYVRERQRGPRLGHGRGKKPDVCVCVWGGQRSCERSQVLGEPFLHCRKMIWTEGMVWSLKEGLLVLRRVPSAPITAQHPWRVQMPRLTGTKCFSFILWLRFWNKRRRRRRRRTWPLLFSSNLIFCLGTNMWRFIETVAPCDKRLLRGKAVFFCQSFSRQHQFRLPFVYLFYNFFFFFHLLARLCLTWKSLQQWQPQKHFKSKFQWCLWTPEPVFEHGWRKT